MNLRTPGKTDWRDLAALTPDPATAHAPQTRPEYAAAARDLVQRGYTLATTADCLRLTVPAVRELLAEPVPTFKAGRT